MVAVIRTTLVLAVIGLAPLSATNSAQEKAKDLAEEDVKLLEHLLRSFLFDPVGAERVQVMVKSPSQRFVSGRDSREGWLVKDKAGDRVFFTDGDSIVAPPKEKISKVDFIAGCRKLYGGEPRPNRWAMGGLLEVRPSGEWGEEPILVHAAWLYRLGEKGLAARAMAHAFQDREADVGLLRKSLAEAALNQMIESYGNYDDQAALTHGERLLRLYAAEAVELTQAAPLYADLLRRKQQGVLGKRAPQEMPEGYSGWGDKRQLEILIKSLDEVQQFIPAPVGGIAVMPFLPPRVAALVNIGESAVPALLDVLEKDRRMTRSVQAPDALASTASVQTVREVALALLSWILRVRHLDPRDPDADDYSERPRDINKAAAAARAYWKEFGPLPYEERMMRVLTHPGSSYPALREAAQKLAWELAPDESSRPGLLKDHEPTPAILRFDNPTAAQAILFAMDRDLANDDLLPLPERDRKRADHEPRYFYSLTLLGDRRIAPELARRAGNESDPLMRLRWADASYRLGQAQTLRTFAKEFAAGKVDLSLETDGPPSRRQLEHIIECFARVPLPETDQALFKLAETGHRYHEATALGLIEREVIYGSVGSFLDHPYCVRILRELLEDKTATGTSVSIREAQQDVQRNGGGYVSWSEIPPVLQDPLNRKPTANLRRCDLAGEMCGLIAGLPAFHPLLSDADDRLAKMRILLDRFQGKYRTLTEVEKQILAGDTHEICFVPDIPSWGRPATEADVKAGRAIFHLGGPGKLAAVELPAQGTFKTTAGEKIPRRGLIVQAEVHPDGSTTYGVIERHAIRQAAASEFAEVIPLKLVKPEER